MNNGLSEEAAIIKANKYSARPEHSEHRTGLCVDFSTESIYGAVNDIFETTEAFEWLIENLLF
jgi:LAS superfamily LD-carboxypeptidase LdcB